MEQRSPEWHEARAKRITASSVGAILGLSPYMSRADAMRNMVREALGAEREFQGNAATEWGTYNEAGALIDFRFKTGLDVEQVGFIPFEDWAGCSPDGLVGDDAGLEIKCPYGLRTAHCPVPFKTLAEQPHYEAQVQFSMFVTGRKRWHFFQWVPNETKLETVEFSQEWADKHIPTLRQFYAEFLDEAKNNAAEHLAPRRPSIDTPEAQAMVAEWDKLKADIAAMQDRQRDLLDSMVSLAGGKDALIAGRRLTQVEREGAVAYAGVVKEHLPDLDLAKYRGKNSRYWKVS
jgi:putative phage-type endonuclease